MNMFQTIKSKIIAHLKAELENTSQGMMRARQDAIDAPGRMQSRYDSSKEESSYLFNSLASRVNEIKKEIETIEDFKQQKNNLKVGIGSLVIIKLNEQTKNLLSMPCCGGLEINDDVIGAVMIITRNSPIFKLIASQPVGFKTIFHGQQLEIIEIL